MPKSDSSERTRQDELTFLQRSVLFVFLRADVNACFASDRVGRVSKNLMHNSLRCFFNDKIMYSIYFRRLHDNNWEILDNN